MSGDRDVRIWIGGLAACALVAAAGCGRAVGTKDPDAAVSHNDSGTDTDAATDPDAGEPVTDVLGWHSVAEEHSGFVTAAEVDPDLLDACSPWLMAAAGGETWWAFGTSGAELLPLYPNLESWEGIGLGRISGHRSDLGDYGHMGMYDRELWVTAWDLQVCPTVERLRHCVAPRAADFCQLPDPFHESRRNHLARILPGPIGDLEHYELTVLYDENVMDGETRFHASFALPLIIDPMDPWAAVPIDQITDLDLTEERLWFGYQVIPYPHAHAGWVLRSTTDDVLRVSLSAEDDNGQPLHLWGDFPVDEIIAYP